MTFLPKYETVVRELTYAIRDLASAQEVATYRTEGGGPQNRVYTIHDEAGAIASAQSRLAGALQAVGEHKERLEKDVLILSAATRATADRTVAKITKRRGRK